MNINIVIVEKIAFSQERYGGEKMVTRLEIFRQEMEPAKEIYTKEITYFAKNYDFRRIS